MHKDDDHFEQTTWDPNGSTWGRTKVPVLTQVIGSEAGSLWVDISDQTPIPSLNGLLRTQTARQLHLGRKLDIRPEGITLLAPQRLHSRWKWNTVPCA